MPERERQTCKQAVVIECDKVPRERELGSDCGFGTKCPVRAQQ